MSKDLLDKISDVDKELADKFKDGGLTNEDIKDLCFEALKEIIPDSGLKGSVLRSRIWNVICESNQNATMSTSSMTKSKTMDGVIDLSIDHSPGTESTTNAITSKSPLPVTLQVKSPTYTIYKDRRVDLAIQTGCLTDDLVHDIVRGTVSNMMSVSLSEPWKRLPTTVELREMAKSLVLTYPLLNDSVKGHGRLFERLKKRVYNKKPVANKRGPNKIKQSAKDKSAKKILEYLSDTENNMSCHEQHEKEPSEAEKQPSKSDDYIEMDVSHSSQPIMDRLYNSLIKELKKSTPSPEVVNTYLNQEFKSRRERIRSMPQNERHMKLFETYPCFRDHVEVVEEVRRIIGVKEKEKDPAAFLQQCAKRFNDELDYFLHFGVAKQKIENANTPNKTAKVIHLMKNLHLIFTGKHKSQKKLADELILVIKNHEDPEISVSSSRRQQTKGLPFMCIDGNKVYILCHPGTVLIELNKKQILEAVLTLVGIFYLMDVDYPKNHEMGLTMIQNLIFGDLSTPADIIDSFKSTKEEYLEYKKSWL